MSSEPLTFADIAESIHYAKRNGVPLRAIKMTHEQRTHLIGTSTFYDRLNYQLIINHDGTCTETIYGLPVEIVHFPDAQQKLFPDHRTPDQKYMDELREWKRLRDAEEDKDD